MRAFWTLRTLVRSNELLILVVAIGRFVFFVLAVWSYVFFSWLQNELSAILRFGAEELFKEEKNDEESKKRLLSMDIDEILERAEKVEEKEATEEQGSELLSAFKARQPI